MNADEDLHEATHLNVARNNKISFTNKNIQRLFREMHITFNLLLYQNLLKTTI